MYRPLQLLFHIEISRGVEICNKPLPAPPWELNVVGSK